MRGKGVRQMNGEIQTNRYRGSEKEGDTDPDIKHNRQGVKL